ncbi:hypothetical protein VKT23_011536 [Stygiomarasmius scandens]|uniref:T6SS Phospholipase effector Tle1-like catalytic domain-containing protein n=1 Tax=Marasmiellus scandens TaxID=2682957 RepID=A0ABR1J9E4_9AGAR
MFRDTVSSVGVVRSDRNLPYTASGMEHVCFFRHALALDERRVKFLPEFARGGAGPSPETEHPLPSYNMPHTKEVWFAGTHSDIGGGNTLNDKLNSNGPALRWMIEEATKAGLQFEPFNGEWSSVRDLRDIHESLTGFWLLLEVFPFKRLTFKDETTCTYKPHLGNVRRIVERQLIHESVFTMSKDYKSRLPRDPTSESSQLDQLINRLFSAIEKWSDEGQRQILLQDLKKEVFVSEYGPFACQTLARSLDHSLIDIQTKDPQLYNTFAALSILVEYGQQRGQGKPDVIRTTRLPIIVPQLLVSDDIDNALKLAAEKYCKIFGDALLDVFELSGRGPGWSLAVHKEVFAFITSDYTIHMVHNDNSTGFSRTEITEGLARAERITFTPNGEQLAGTTIDNKIFFLDTKTGKKCGEVIQNPYTNNIAGIGPFGLMFSTDGQQRMLHWGGNSISIWSVELETHQYKFLQAQELEGLLIRIVDASLSANGSKVVFATSNRTIRVWSVDEGSDFTIQENAVKVIMSKDGKQIFVSSDDAIRILDASTGNRVRDIWEATSEQSQTRGAPRLLELSPDEAHIAGVFRDGTVQVWNVAQGELLFRTRISNRSPELSLAFFPDGQRIGVCTGKRKEGVIDYDTVVCILDTQGPCGKSKMEKLMKNKSRILANSSAPLNVGVGNTYY